MNELFSRIDWSGFVANNKNGLNDEITKLDGTRLLNTSEEALVKYFVEKYYFTVPTINESEISVEQQEIDVDVSNAPDRFFFNHEGPFYVKGTQITFYIPFVGEDIFFQVRPTSYYMQRFSGTICNNCIIFSISNTEHNPDNVKRAFETYLRELKDHLDTQRQDSAAWNVNLASNVRQQISLRRAKLLKDQNMVSSLGYKMRTNPAAPITYGAPEVKRKELQLPPASMKPYKAEPTLLDEDYESILSILENMIHVMERSPKAFKDINEEALRMHFLVQLNGHFEGCATGETFNFNGKTDILIRSADKNIFIAECKFWKGKVQYLDTINQILSYSSWRDTKVAVLIFNRNKNMSQVLDTVKACTQEHPNYLRQKSQSSEGRFRFIFSQPSDSNREMIVTVMVFDVPEGNGT